MENTSWMDEVAQNEMTGDLMKQLQEQTAKLRELEFAMMAAEDAYNQAKDAFTEYATKILPDLYLRNGIDSMTTTDGKTVRIVTKTSASIKKGSDQGATSKRQIAEWLRKHDGAHLIKQQNVVDGQATQMLVDAGIPFRADMDINTNSLKAFIVGALGQTGSPATITADDLPQGLSFYQWSQAEVS